jgi:non-heme chloroperoxidase
MASITHTRNLERGPLLIIDGEKDHTAPWAIPNASYNRQSRNQGGDRDREDPQLRALADIDSGWREVAETTLAFVKRFV